MLYWSAHNEVETHELVCQALKDAKKVFLPTCDTKQGQIHPCSVSRVPGDLRAGSFGICEPSDNGRRLQDLSELDLCIVPGIAFDPRGNRIGPGFGYYDRFLRKLSGITLKIGVAYAFQIVDNIYPTDGDTRVDMVVTEDDLLVADRR
jgi:5-formyltetrahydrofolate cyclo-ligase